MRKKWLTLENVLYAAFFLAVVFYLAGIFWVNLHGQQWYNYDIYADAMFARQVVEEGCLFPGSWTFGNQLYVVATPVISALFYLLCENAILSLGLASCVMTVLTAASFWWCVKPFTGKLSRIAGLLSLLGGTLIGYSAAVDINGMQVFYTMASYYSCYVIGIFFAMGIWLRLSCGQRVHWLVVATCAVYHFALGIQSLREMLVLHLPLCTLVVLMTLARKTPWKAAIADRSNQFAAGMLAVNGLGILTGKLLIALIPIRQADILVEPGNGLLENLQICTRELWQYIGLHLPEYNAHYILKFVSGAVCLAVVAFALIHILKTRSKTPLACMILFGVISLAAVFAAGLLFVRVRTIYYFMWYPLAALGFVYIAENMKQCRWVQYPVLLVLLGIGILNWNLAYTYDSEGYSESRSFYKETAHILVKEGVTHLYYDESTAFLDASRLAAYSGDKFLSAAFSMNCYDDQPDNLLTYIPYLASSEWFDPENVGKAYLMLPQAALDLLAEERFADYSAELFSHLTLEHHVSYGDLEYYFYSFDQALFQDLIRE